MQREGNESTLGVRPLIVVPRDVCVGQEFGPSEQRMLLTEVNQFPAMKGTNGCHLFDSKDSTSIYWAGRSSHGDA